MRNLFAEFLKAKVKPIRAKEDRTSKHGGDDKKDDPATGAKASPTKSKVVL
jgi:hypothetical protein